MTAEIKKLIAKRQQLWFNGPRGEWREAAYHVTAKIAARKNQLNRKFKLGDVNWWKEVNKARISQTANMLNDSFYNIWSGLKQPDLAKFIKADAGKEYVPIFNINNVTTALNQLSTSASGPDNLAAMMLKSARLELADTITDPFNSCLALSFTS